MPRQAENMSDTDGRDAPFFITMSWDDGGYQKWSIDVSQTLKGVSPCNLGKVPCDLLLWVRSGSLRVVRSDGEMSEVLYFSSGQERINKGDELLIMAREDSNVGARSLEPQTKRVAPKEEGGWS